MGQQQAAGAFFERLLRRPARGAAKSADWTRGAAGAGGGGARMGEESLLKLFLLKINLTLALPYGSPATSGVKKFGFRFV